jgi:methoxymalonate biosynthesis protein
MNATGIHYPESTLRSLIDDPQHEVLVSTLTDRFGSHGAVGVLLVERHEAVWRLKLLTTSCRVLPYGIGTHLLTWLIAQAAAAGVHLVADFRKTDRNRMMEIAYRLAGFAERECACLPVIKVAASEGIRLLHLCPDSRQFPSVMKIIAPHFPAMRSSGLARRAEQAQQFDRNGIRT